MTQKESLDELEALMSSASRSSRRPAETTLSRGLGGSLGLDSPDLIELTVAIEERFGIVSDETERSTGEPVARLPLPRRPLTKVK